MRRYLLLLGMLLVLLGQGQRAESQVVTTVIIRAQSVLRAGDPLLVTVKAESVRADEVDIVLLNGTQRLDHRMRLNSNGVGTWQIPGGQLTQSGVSIVLVVHDGEIYRHTIDVLATRPVHLDLLTSARYLSAGGSGIGMLMALAYDQWGNMVSPTQSVQTQVRYPTGEQRTFGITLKDGLGWRWVGSAGDPGRVRITATFKAVSATFELFQVAGPPAMIELVVRPDCILADGRDVYQLMATVHDSRDYPVADGTLVTFEWEDGRGYGTAISGAALLRLPGPTQAGTYQFTATSGDVESEPQTLVVAEDRCP